MNFSSILASKRLVAVPLAVAALATTGLVIATNALFAGSSTVGGNAFTTGTVDLATTPTTAVVAMSGMAPGDSNVGEITVQNTGSLGLRYAMKSTVTSGGLQPVLQMTVKTGVTTCDVAGFAGTGTIVYGPATLGATTGTKVIGDAATGQQSGDRTLVSGASEKLCIKVDLPPATTDTYENATATATFAFDAEQTKNN